LAEMEAGHPDELTATLRALLKEASDPVGSLPAGIDPTEWAVRRFIEVWKGPARSAIKEIEGRLRTAAELCGTGKAADAVLEIDLARQILGEDLREHLGLHDLHEDRG